MCKYETGVYMYNNKGLNMEKMHWIKHIQHGSNIKI